MYKIEENKEGDTCPNCMIGDLELVIGIEPYSEDHLQCNNCDSTYILNK